MLRYVSHLNKKNKKLKIRFTWRCLYQKQGRENQKSKTYLVLIEFTVYFDISYHHQGQMVWKKTNLISIQLSSDLTLPDTFLRRLNERQSSRLDLPI